MCCDGRVVKALDLKSNGIFPRRFEPYSQRYFHHRFPVSCPTRTISIVSYLLSCDGRVVKAFDSKSNGIFPRRFESYSQRLLVCLHFGDHEDKMCIFGESNPSLSRCRRDSPTEPKTSLHCRGIEPRSPAWQARILPLNQQCLPSSIFHSRVRTSKWRSCVNAMLYKTDHDGDRTHNLPIRSRTPYPLGHAADETLQTFWLQVCQHGRTYSMSQCISYDRNLWLFVLMEI